jgi:hypothetical protein
MPDCALKDAHEGRFWMLKVSGLPLGSVVVGVKLYTAPAPTEVAGEPPIVGGGSAGAVTVMAKAASEAPRVPSLTLMTMLEKVPTFAVDGVPESLPVVLLKFAQEGRFATENVSGLPSGLLAVGVKPYALPATTLVRATRR